MRRKRARSDSEILQQNATHARSGCDFTSTRLPTRRSLQPSKGGTRLHDGRGQICLLGTALQEVFEDLAKDVGCCLGSREASNFGKVASWAAHLDCDSAPGAGRKVSSSILSLLRSGALQLCAFTPQPAERRLSSSGVPKPATQRRNAEHFKGQRPKALGPPLTGSLACRRLYVSCASRARVSRSQSGQKSAKPKEAGGRSGPPKLVVVQSPANQKQVEFQGFSANAKRQTR